MPRVRFLDGPTVEMEEGETVMDAAERLGIDLRNACGADCRCSTCRVEVLEGAEHCADPKANELEVLAVNGLRPPIRLACQLRPKGDVTVRVLLRASQHTPPPSLADGLAQEREVVVLFADIRNFTTFAERQLPFDVLHLLNLYFDRVGTVVENHQGHVVSFEGDALMALFLGGRATSAIAATDCGLHMLEACRQLSAYSNEHFSFDLCVGIGIDSGRALVGQVGYYRHSRLTAIGDVVNTASRVQELTKESGANLLVTETVYERARDRFRFGREFAADLRGKAGRHNVYEVLGAK